MMSRWPESFVPSGSVSSRPATRATFWIELPSAAAVMRTFMCMTADAPFGREPIRHTPVAGS